ncbi:hypothetical protein JYU34_003063 [Plutella xylostella]|uniref:Uncharacterized protein n=1 Tax=Plutella xylostella TaxID=51655 RepID=A0ABQ7QZ35_PLUXY|nr:hypothetical protein JYU34_003063 [Plutella xylostella]
MSFRNVLVVFALSCVVFGAALGDEGEVTARGKKKKLGLFIFIADIIIKKIFILKIVYAIIFWIVIHKAGYFLTWFVSYLSDQKKEFKEVPHVHYGPHHSYGTPDYSSYGPPHDYSSYGPYKRITQR